MPDTRARHPETRLSDKAADNLQFIRSTMESAGVFTGISGLGYLLTGFTALAAAALAASRDSATAWFAVWMAELVLAILVAGTFSVIKSRRQGQMLKQATLRKLLAAFLPAMAAGGLLTLVMFLQGLIHLLPGIWLSLYGAAVITAGAWSVRVLPLMGLLFMTLGALAMLSPLPVDWLMAAGFGGLHIGFGLIIWRRYGG